MDADFPERNNLHLACRTKRFGQVAFLFQASEPAYVMLLLRKSRKLVDDAMNSVSTNEERIALVGAACKLADVTARYAQVPTAPKGAQVKSGDNAKPILPIA